MAKPKLEKRNRTKYPSQVGYDERQRDSGLVRVSVWVHAANRQKLINTAKKLKRAAE
mgnify:CR=1 FL=1|jgi:hypothetical protein